MRSETASSATASSATSSGVDTETLLRELRQAAGTLARAERSALARIARVERSLLQGAPRLEVWTEPVFRDQSKPPRGLGSAAKVLSRSVALGFAPLEQSSALVRWVEAANLPLSRRWGLVAREEYRSESGKSALVRVIRLRKADLAVRVALAPRLDTLLRAVLDDVRSRVEQLPEALRGRGRNGHLSTERSEPAREAAEQSLAAV